MPYIMGANITTLADTLVAAMILGRPEGVQVVLAEAIGVAMVTVLYLAFAYGHLQRAIMRLDEWVVTNVRRLIGFVAVLFVTPGVLLLSGRIVGVSGEVARGGSAELWLSLGAAVLVALPVWAMVDAIGRPERYWRRFGKSKGAWIAMLSATAPFGLGFLVAMGYLIRVRQLLSIAEIQSAVAVWGDELPA